MVEKMISFSWLYNLKEKTQQALTSITIIASLQNVSLSVPQSQIKALQAYLMVICDEDLMTIIPTPKLTLLIRIIDICYLKDSEILLGINEAQLKVKISFVNYHFNYLVNLKMPKLWEDLNVQNTTSHGLIIAMLILSRMLQFSYFKRQ